MYQDPLDSLEKVKCLCGLMPNGALCVDGCDLASEGKAFDAQQVPMVELSDMIENMIDNYKTIPPSAQRNAYRKQVSSLIRIANRRSLNLNKVTLFKSNWW